VREIKIERRKFAMSAGKVSLFVCLIGLMLGLALCVPLSEGQTSLGNVQQSSISSASCSTLSADRGGFDSAYITSCYEATLSGCPGADNIVFFYGIAPPATGTSPLGTVVLLPGNGGTLMPPDFSAYLASYSNAGYQVIEVVWGENPNGQDWEYVNSGGGQQHPQHHGCRLPPCELA
jgi:hypothetical protein